MKFSSPGGTTYRPFQGWWLVPMDPNWVHQSHLAAIHRYKTVTSGTNEFQIRPDSQLQHEHELIGRRERPLRGTSADLQVDAESAAVRRIRAAGSSAEGSPRACRRLRLSSAGFAIQRNSDPRSGGLQITSEHRSQTQRNKEASCGGVGLPAV